MRHAIVLQHVPGEGPGLIRPIAERLGFSVKILCLDAGATVPERLDAQDLLVVMGGPMGVGDLGDARWPFLTAEVALLRQRVAADLPTLGVCLGAQLLAHAAGARVAPNRDAQGRPALEVGWGPVDFPDFAAEPLLSGLKAQEDFLHWHGDTFALPAGARLLASTPRCKNQAFVLKRRLVGLQFHPEVDGVDLDPADWVRDDADFVTRANGPGGGATILADTARLLPRQRAVGERLLGNLLGSLK